MGNYFLWKRDFLAHHGIKGQKWGIRRYQNEDGSLTAEGKEHYGIKDFDSKSVLEDFRNGKSNATVEGYKRAIAEHADAIDKTFWDIHGSATKDYEKNLNDKNFKNGMLNYFRKMHGNNETDEWALEDSAYEYINNNILSKETKALYEKFEDLSADYNKNVEKFTDTIVKNLGDEKITSKGQGYDVKNTWYGQKLVPKIIEKSFKDTTKDALYGNNTGPRYQFNHIEAALDPTYLDDNLSNKQNKFISDVIKEYKGGR